MEPPSARPSLAVGFGLMLNHLLLFVEVLLMFLDFVLSKGKRNNKIDFVKVISDYFPSASERRANGEVLITSAKTVIERLALTLVDGKQSAVKPPAIEPATLEGFF